MSSVLVRRDGSVAVLVLNRAARRNALDAPTRTALLGALHTADADPEVRAVVLTGEGHGFCAGQDLSAVDELEDARRTVALGYNPLVRAIVGSDKPVVAAVNGAAVGAGMGLALACDHVVAAEQATLSCAFGRMALVPDTGTSWFLVRALGHRRAFELATSGRAVPAAEALALGLVDEVVPAGEVLAAATRRAAALAEGPQQAFALTKRLLVAAADRPLGDLLDLEARSQGHAARTAEHVARRTAFLDRT